MITRILAMLFNSLKWEILHRKWVQVGKYSTLSFPRLLSLTPMIRNPTPSVSNTHGYSPALAQTCKDGYINTIISVTPSGIPQEPCYSAWTSTLIKAGDFMVSWRPLTFLTKNKKMLRGRKIRCPIVTRGTTHWRALDIGQNTVWGEQRSWI